MIIGLQATILTLAVDAYRSRGSSAMRSSLVQLSMSEDASLKAKLAGQFHYGRALLRSRCAERKYRYESQ
jgi:hypothetical protein